ncbi:MAG: hypothetical protein MUE85_06885 [Microscillaceae bacterium]|jgi:hypothetical protein|nr:hypothetical protein [Microscillaceae bacterium]
MRHLLILFLIGLLIFSCKEKESKVQKANTAKTLVVEKKPKTTVIPDSMQWKYPKPDSYFERYLYYDINRDGFKDSVIVNDADGWKSKYSNHTILAINGKDQKKMQIKYIDHFPLIKHLVKYPLDYESKINYPFLEVMKTGLGTKAQKPDPSLQWIIEGLMSRHNLINHLYFQQVFRFKPRFLKGDFKFPESYYLEIDTDTLEKVAKSMNYPELAMYEPSDYISNNSNQEMGKLLIYRGSSLYSINIEAIKKMDSNYKELKKVTKSKMYQIYTMSHAVAAQKGNAYAYIFVSDYDLNGKNYRRSMPSIKNVDLIKDGYVLITKEDQKSLHNFLVNIETGFCVELTPSRARMNFEVLMNEMDKLAK